MFWELSLSLRIHFPKLPYPISSLPVGSLYSHHSRVLGPWNSSMRGRKEGREGGGKEEMKEGRTEGGKEGRREGGRGWYFLL